MRTLNPSTNGWVQWFHILLNANSPKLDLKVTKDLDNCPEDTTLGVEPTMQEMTDVIRPFANGKAVGPDGVSVGCSISPSKVIPPCERGCTISSFAFGGGGGAHFQFVCFLRQLRFQGSILTQGDRCSQEDYSRNIIRPVRLMPCPFSTVGFSSFLCCCPLHHEERAIKCVKGLYPAGDSCCQMFHEATSV